MLSRKLTKKPSHLLRKSQLSITIQTILYGALLTFLLIRKKAEDPSALILDTAKMPSYLTPLLNNSLYISIAIMVSISFFRVASKKIAPPSKYILIYLFAILTYNIRLFDSSEPATSLAGVAIPFLMLITATPPSKRISGNALLENSLILCFSALTLVNSLLLFLGYGYHGFRFSGVSFHPNQLGIASGISTIFFISILTSTKNKTINKSLFTVLLSLSLILLISSGSRGAIAATALGLAALLIFTRKIKALIIVLIAGPMAYSLISALFPENATYLNSRITDTGDNRSEVWNKMLSGFMESPLIGLGADSIGSENSILKAFSVGGILCGIPILIFTIKIAKEVISYQLKSQKSKEHAKYYAILVAIITASLIDGYLFERVGFIGLLTALIFTFSIERNQQNSSTPIQTKNLET